MTDPTKLSGIAISIAIAVMVIAAMASSAAGYVESVDSTAEWEAAINESATVSNYTIEDGTIVKESSGEPIRMDTVDVRDKGNITFTSTLADPSPGGSGGFIIRDVTGSAGDYEPGTAVTGGEIGDTVTIPAEVEEYYVEFDLGSPTIDSYQATEDDTGDLPQQIALLIIGVLGLGILAMLNS